jgi:hypothetical protein
MSGEVARVDVCETPLISESRTVLLYVKELPVLVVPLVS